MGLLTWTSAEDGAEDSREQRDPAHPASPHDALGQLARVEPTNGAWKDPFGVHEDRYFSDGNPTKLVRDGAAEAYDEPPPGPLPGPLVEVPPSEPEGSSGLRRADDGASSPGVVGRRKLVMPADIDIAAFYGPVN